MFCLSPHVPTNSSTYHHKFSKILPISVGGKGKKKKVPVRHITVEDLLWRT